MTPRRITQRAARPSTVAQSLALALTLLSLASCDDTPASDTESDGGPVLGAGDAQADSATEGGAPDAQTDGAPADADLSPDGDADPDGSIPGQDAAAPADCETDDDCDDGVACNGSETCAITEDGRGTCQTGISQCPAEHPCVAARDECECSNPDFDGDGDPAEVCGGTDCNDALRHIHDKSGLEVCDPYGHDEDCNPSTYGGRDDDGDGFDTADCFNIDWITGERVSGGDDCDDHNPNVHPNQPEVCDYFDNNCNGLVDEDGEGNEHGLRNTFYPDADGDGHGADGSEPELACFFDQPIGYVMASEPSDPDDDNPSIYDGAPEICDGKDNNGDGRIDSDDTGLSEHDKPEFADTTVTCEDGHWSIPEGGCPADRLWCPDRVQCLDGVDWCRAKIERGCDVEATLLSSCRACATDCHFSCGQEGCDEIVKVVSGGDQSCAITREGRAACWGRGSFGRLGDDSTVPRSRPGWVIGISDAKDIAVGAQHACAAIGPARELWCWGRNDKGQLGSEDESDYVPVPVRVSSTSLSTTEAASIAAGVQHTCVVKTNGELLCFGWSEGGLLGNDLDVQDARKATPVVRQAELFGVLVGEPIQDAVEVAVGRMHGCARLKDGTVGCWGDNTYGQLGDGHVSDKSLVFQVVEGLADVEKIAAGDLHTCALSHGKAYCWGDNARHQLGRPTGDLDGVPEPIADLEGIEDIAAGQLFTCARSTTGSVACWGSNAFGQLGVDEPLYSTSPVQLPIVDIKELSPTGGAEHICALRLDGTAVCWGRNVYGQLGLGHQSDESIDFEAVSSVIGARP